MHVLNLVFGIYENKVVADAASPQQVRPGFVRVSSQVMRNEFLTRTRAHAVSRKETFDCIHMK